MSKTAEEKTAADDSFAGSITRAVYLRQLEGNGMWLGEEPIELEAECFQDSGLDFGSEVLVVWTDATLAKLASLDLNAEELVGATEAMEEAFWASEEEQCRLDSVAQRFGFGVTTEQSFAATRVMNALRDGDHQRAEAAREELRALMQQGAA